MYYTISSRAIRGVSCNFKGDVEGDNLEKYIFILFLQQKMNLNQILIQVV